MGNEDIRNIVGEVVSIMSNIQNTQFAFDMRRRFNPHHSDEQVRYEKEVHEDRQLTLWFTVKKLYCRNRDDILKFKMSNALTDVWLGYLGVMERIIDDEAMRAIEKLLQCNPDSIE